MKNFRGGITVFLSLVLTIIISLLFVVIEAARSNSVDFQTSCAMDAALQSVLAEYNREALEQYDLFLIDAGYGTEEKGYILLEEHIRNYMQKNLTVEKGIFSGGITDLLQLSADFSVILKAAGAADGYGRVLERQAVDYMLDRYGIPDLSSIHILTKTVENEGFLGSAMEEKRVENEQAIDDVDTTVEDEDGKKHKIPVNNPADGVNSRRGSTGILKKVTEKSGISERQINPEQYISHRAFTERDGFLTGERAVSSMEDLLFQKYLMEKCGNYTKPKENSYLVYEMEYLLAGKNSDRENLHTVVNRLLVIREAANFVYLLSDSEKKAEAEALAMTLSAVTMFPELKDLIKMSILIGWAYAESVNDVKILLEGGRIPLLKSSADWRLDLKHAMKLELEEEGNGSSQGLSYEEYLYALLAAVHKKERNLRFMDLMEMNIRQTRGNENFCMDNCICEFTAEITVSSGKGYHRIITRTSGYFK